MHAKHVANVTLLCIIYPTDIVSNMKICAKHENMSKG